MANELIENVHKRGYKAIVVNKDENIISILREYKPEAILLSLDSANQTGKKILNLVKGNLQVRHIPTGIISTSQGQASLKKYGRCFITKSESKKEIDQMIDDLLGYASKKQKRLLVVKEGNHQNKQIEKYTSFSNVETVFANSRKQAISLIENDQFDAMLVDLDKSGTEIIEDLKKKRKKETPILIYLSETPKGNNYSKLSDENQVIIRKNNHQIHHLTDQLILNLNIPYDALSSDKKKSLDVVNDSSEFLKGKKILIVDDDIRNIFALTSFFDSYKSKIFSAEGGKEAIYVLNKNKDIDIILMDIMMPDMDGYTTIQKIRSDKKFASLPIVAVTAKAMPEDREKCMKAGATEYIKKPIDTNELISVIKFLI